MTHFLAWATSLSGSGLYLSHSHLMLIAEFCPWSSPMKDMGFWYFPSSLVSYHSLTRIAPAFSTLSTVLRTEKSINIYYVNQLISDCSRSFSESATRVKKPAFFYPMHLNTPLVLLINKQNYIYNRT